MPGVTYFKPRGIPMRLLEEVRLSVDELEALRLKDLLGLEQEEAAREMAVSRQTFQRIQDEAHRKVAEALVTGKALEIDGGDYEVAPMHLHCRRCGHSWEQLLTGGIPVACPNCEEKTADLHLSPGYAAGAPGAGGSRGAGPGGTRIAPAVTVNGPDAGKSPTKELRTSQAMKIAVISDDGESISMHFGRAQYYVVASVEDGKVMAKEVRPKVGHHTFGDHPHEEQPGMPHGYDAASQNKHSQMAANISDCKVLLAGGMGWGAYDSLKGYGIEPIITDIHSIDQAVRAYLDGTIRNLSDRLH